MQANNFYSLLPFFDSHGSDDILYLFGVSDIKDLYIVNGSNIGHLSSDMAIFTKINAADSVLLNVVIMNYFYSPSSRVEYLVIDNGVNELEYYLNDYVA